MLHFTDNNLKIHQVARDRKAKHLRIGCKHLSVARRLGLSEKSTTFRYWSAFLSQWQQTPIDVIVADIERKQTL